MFDYNDYPIELKIFRATVLKAKMVQVQTRNNRNYNKFLKYVNSSKARHDFATWIIHSFYADRDLTAAMICAEMGISRKAVDEMVKDWEAEEWLYKEKGEGIHIHKYFLHPSNEILNTNDEWFQWYEEEILPLIHRAFDFYRNSKENLQELKHDSNFNTSTTTNLSAIEDVVTSFILNSKKREIKWRQIKEGAK